MSEAFSEDLLEPQFNNISVDLDSINYSNPMLSIPGPKGAEYIFENDYQPKRMSWADRSTWLLGGSWLTGAAIGGVTGGFRGLRSVERGLPWKLRLNAFLNGAGKRGSRMANGLGALGLLYSGVETLSWQARQKQDSLNIIAGTTIAPLIYWSGGNGPINRVALLIFSHLLTFLIGT